MFVNTYHQIVQPPGVDLIGEAGGLHRFLNYDKPILTDSGGFQVFSLGGAAASSSTNSSNDVEAVELKGQQRGRYEPSVAKVTEHGVHFKSYLNGDAILLTPESSVEAQQKLASDIIVPLDELPSNNWSKDDVALAMARTHRWQLRSLATHRAHVHSTQVTRFTILFQYEACVLKKKNV